MERQLKLKTSEASRFKKKVHELEQAAAKEKNAAPSEANIFTTALSKANAVGSTTGSAVDERRVLLLKA